MPRNDLELFLTLVSAQTEAWNAVDAHVKAVPNMSAARLTVLNELSQFPAGISVTELAKRQNISDGAASKFCDRLVKDGLITRERSDIDKRVQVLLLTEAGATALKEGVRRAQHASAEFFSALSPDQRNDLQHLLTSLRHTPVEE